MVSLTPHRDVVEFAIARSAEQVAAMPEAKTAATRINRALSSELTAATLRAWADAQDQGVDLAEFIKALQTSLGSALSSFSISATVGQIVPAGVLVTMLCLEAQKAALRGLSGQFEAETTHRYPRPEAGRG